MARSEPQTFSARMASLPLALGFVEAFCAQHGIDPGDVLRLTLIVEELFTNTVVHGHGGDRDAPLRIELEVDATQLRLRFEDDAPPFDPLHYLARTAPQLDGPVAERQVGGLGLPLVAQMAEQFEYARFDGCNRLNLAIRRGA